MRRDPKTRLDGGLYIFNALAFSTLLSSQDTDALRVPEFLFRPSRRLFKFTRFFLLVKSAPVRFPRTSRPNSTISELPEPTAYRPLAAERASTRCSNGVLSWWLPGSGTAFHISDSTDGAAYINDLTCTGWGTASARWCHPGPLQRRRAERELKVGDEPQSRLLWVCSPANSCRPPTGWPRRSTSAGVAPGGMWE